ncbi:hypothetical protein [uncultured Lacinutrix sp.]|uniref:hypothetical protein n=1 Tax=uncultured Lacinutrix sp. TaxID=574032 RepID=UPI0026349152|nr:hypothetical protein [uncultured Lacinutrix sp.]
MKNLGSLILGLIIGALVMYFYCCKLGTPDVVDPDITKPSGIITPKEAIALDALFNSRHKLISDSIVKRPDNRSSWWSLDDIENYLAYAKHQTDSLGFPMDGVRVYLGAYPDTKVDSTTVVGYTTMFMVPTSSKLNIKGGSGAAYRAGGDVSGADGLNDGYGGNPPSANYPQ